MQQIDFYHLKDADLATPLAMLATKIVASGHKFLILARPIHFVEISKSLWVYRPDNFLAHGFDDDEGSEYAPVWLSSHAENNPIKADYVAMCDGFVPPHIDSFARLFHLFDGQNEESVKIARSHWKDWSEQAELTCRYFAQDEQGKWTQKQ